MDIVKEIWMLSIDYFTYIEKGIEIIHLELETPLTEQEWEEASKCNFLFRSQKEAEIAAFKVDNCLLKSIRKSIKVK